MEKTGRKALFQDAPSNGGSDGGNEILGDWAKILKSAVEGDTSARINIDSVDGPLKSLGETLNLAIEKISADSDDINNKKRLIGNAQKRYREIVQQNPMPMLLINKEFKVVVTNPAYEEMSGYTRDELRKMNLRDFHVEGKAGDGIKKALSAGIRSTGEVVVNLPSGTHTLEQHCIPVRNDANEITNVLLAYQDLTDLRQEMAETNLLKKQAELFIKQNPQAIAVLGPDKSRIDLNKEYERVWRGSYEELMRKKLYDFDITMTGGEDFYASYETKRLAISDMELKWPNGEKTYVTLYQVPILDDNGDILVNYYIYQDRTAEVEEKGAIQLLQKQSEAFIKQNPQAITVLGPDKSRIDLNKEYERVWRGSYEELMRKKLYDFDITMTGGEDFYASYETKRLAISEMTLNWQNGEKTYVTLYQVPILDDNGDILVNYYIYQDRTHEVEEKEAIEILQKQSEAFIKQNPQAIAVLGPDKSRIDINKEYERVWRGSYEELMRKKLYDFDITMTGGEDFYASYESKRLAISDMELKWPNGERTYVRLYQVPILDDNDNILVNYYIYQDLTKDILVEKYLNTEVERLKGNLEMFAKGDLEFHSVVDEGNEYTTVAHDNFARINGSIDEVRDAVGAVLGDVGRLAEAAVEGKLDTRVDASAHNGEFANVVEGVNGTLDAMVGPLNVTAEYVDRISKGDVPEKVTDDWNGDFNEIKNNLNACIDGLGGLVESNAVLQKMANNDYTMKVEGNYVGLYADVADATNAVTERLLHLQATAQNIAVGDLSDLGAYKSIGQRSENDQLLPSFISMMENIEAVVNDANTLAEAGVNGQLETRADASKYEGDFRKIVEGLNNTLDAVVGPLNVATDFLDGIAAGSKLEEITGDYHGEYARIKDSANECYNVLNALLNETIGLTEAGVAGNLDVRGNVENYGGAWSMIVGGINDTMDAMVGPLNVTAEYVDRISKGDVPEKITDAYAGDFNEIKNNLNACIDGLGGLVEANAVLQKMADNDYTAKVEGDYVGLYADVAGATNAVTDRLLHLQDTAQNIAAGDLGDLKGYKAIGRRSENDRLIPSFISMMENIQAVVNDVNLLAEAGVNGQVEIRADASKHQGDFRKIVEGINGTLDAIGAPLGETISVLERMAVNDYTTKVENKYPGDYAKLTENLNEVLVRLAHVQETLQNIAVGDLSDLNDYKTLGKRSANDLLNPSFIGMIENIQAVVEDANMVAQAGVNGQLDVRADATRHAGAYREVIVGINDTMDAVVGPLKVAADFIDDVALGTEFKPITNEFRGDYARIKESSIKCQDVLTGLINDIVVLTQAAAEGRLDTRGNVEAYDGAWRMIVSGINDTLDAMVGPMNVTAEYVDRIAKGDIPDKITDVYVGDFNEIKNNLNQCIDAVNLLVIDSNMLVEAAAAGRLTARADVSHHAGDYAKIVGGINQTLDIINEPFREMNAAIAQLDITADETSRGADEIGKAAEQVAVTSQQCADLSTSLINQIEAVDRQIADLSASNEEIASTSQEVHEHAVQTAKIGEKAQQLGAEANTKMNNVEIIAKQSVDEINTLNSRMQEIDNVVKQVNDITNQINLLALNAAIEAARAGEHGRGFAVVAGEVRNLAEEAKQATGQIDQVIAGVQAISAKTAEEIGSAHAEIGYGVVSVNETIEALNEIVQGSQDMKINIDEIAKAIEEQANMANRIVEAMEESGRLTRENQGQVEELASLAEEASASTEEIGSSIHEVKNMAGDLKQTMDRFEV